MRKGPLAHPQLSRDLVLVKRVPLVVEDVVESQAD